MNMIQLPAEFTQPCLAKLHEEVDALIKNKQDFLLDGSQVQRVDGAAVQYLLVCQKTVTSESEEHLLNPSDVLSDALGFLASGIHCSPVNESIQTQ